MATTTVESIYAFEIIAPSAFVTNSGSAVLLDLDAALTAATASATSDSLPKVSPVVTSGGLTITAGGFTITAGAARLAIASVGDYADDAAAAIGGVPVGGVYRTLSVLKIRVA